MYELEIHRLTTNQVEAGERHLQGRGDPNDASTYSKVRRRLQGWEGLVDLSVREAVLAQAEAQEDVLQSLVRAAVNRMLPGDRQLLLRQLREEHPRGGLGSPDGAFPVGESGSFLGWHPEVARVVRILWKAGEEGLGNAEFLRRAHENERLSKRRARIWLQRLQEQGSVQRQPRPTGNPGRPPMVWVLTEGGRHLATDILGLD